MKSTTGQPGNLSLVEKRLPGTRPVETATRVSMQGMHEKFDRQLEDQEISACKARPFSVDGLDVIAFSSVLLLSLIVSCALQYIPYRVYVLRACSASAGDNLRNSN